MRPLSLEMQAFGPYAGTQKLDFRELGDRSLFLIHGPTGSGKSTILDAICVALYGETSGDEREGGQMRSDHAPRELKTRVVYEFAIGDDIYWIGRTPRYPVLREDGETFRTEPHAVEMWHRNGADDEAQMIASGVRDVGEQVERLLGLREDQFRQVVVLPQGRFRELLTASSLERERIFSTLFQTYHYRTIQNRLKEKSSLIRDELERHSLRRQNILQLAGVESHEALLAKITELDQQVTELNDKRVAQERAVKTSQESLQRAEEADRKLRTVTETSARVRELDDQRETVADNRKRLCRAKKAAELSDAETYLSERIREAKTSEETRDDLKRRVAEAKGQLEQAEQEKQAADALQPEIDELRENHRTLEGLRPRISALADAELALSNARAAVRDCEDAHREVSTALQAAAGELETTQKHLTSASLQSRLIDGLSGRVTELKRQARQRKQLDERQQVLITKLEEQDQAETALETAEIRLKDAQTALDLLDAAWRQGQAIVLAGQLEDEQPCPVCGSVHHPAPATGDDEVPTEAQLERHKDAVNTARSNRDRESNRKIALDEQVRTLTGQVQELRDELDELVEIPVADLDQQVVDAESQLKIARTEAELVDELGTRVTALNEQTEALQQRLNRAERALTQAKLDERSATSAYDTALREVPEEYRSLEAVDTAIETINAEIARRNDRVEAATRSLEAARSHHTSLTGQLEAAQREAERDRKQADDAADEFARRRLQQGFADDEAYQSARLPKQQIDQLEQAINQYDENLSIARDRLKSAEEDAKGLEQPDLESLQSAVRTAEAERDKTIRDHASRVSEQERLQHASTQIDEIRNEIERLDGEYSVAEYLSSVANGEVTYSRHRISFERFVLGAFLDEVLVVATEKLRMMTSGRYQLLRKLYGEDGRRSTGLDLEVEDAFTGVARNVSTLSGGEGFQAALALALGLSEVVQNRSGGIRLETLFVDEGFGSLDPDALDKSLNMLVDLHQSRLIGIISHVPELQERINARLSVEAGRNGSTARIIV